MVRSVGNQSKRLQCNGTEKKPVLWAKDYKAGTLLNVIHAIVAPIRVNTKSDFPEAHPLLASIRKRKLPFYAGFNAQFTQKSGWQH